MNGNIRKPKRLESLTVGASGGRQIPSIVKDKTNLPVYTPSVIKFTWQSWLNFFSLSPSRSILSKTFRDRKLILLIVLQNNIFTKTFNYNCQCYDLNFYRITFYTCLCSVTQRNMLRIMLYLLNSSGINAAVDRKMNFSKLSKGILHTNFASIAKRHNAWRFPIICNAWAIGSTRN